ncbi:MAG: short-chain dehydrogenase [Alphaproteobacteria bacterium PA4]|nr:MAG: short-chain dehydrogenase [Alphaproteobacteria bacterium PA4]
MSRLSSFTSGMHAVVIGARGGIGAALATLLEADDRVTQVSRLGRHTGLDVTNPDSVTAAAAGLAAPPDLVICTVGLLHAPDLAPERALRQLDPAAMARSFAVNAIGPALIAQAFLPLLPRGRKTLFAALSARVGSIADNRLGGWHSYRASKAALNQLMRTMAIEQARRNPDSILLSLHPGTVDTDLSQPFHRSVPALLQPLQAARHLVDVINAATPDQSGQLLDWQGLVIPY